MAVAVAAPAPATKSESSGQHVVCETHFVMSSVNTQANCLISWFIHPTALTNHCLTPAHSNYRPSTCVSTFVSALADSTMPALCTVLDEPLVPRSVLIASWCLCSFRSFSVASARCCILLRECFGRSDAVSECNVVYCMLHLTRGSSLQCCGLWLPQQQHQQQQQHHHHSPVRVAHISTTKASMDIMSTPTLDAASILTLTSSIFHFLEWSSGPPKKQPMRWQRHHHLQCGHKSAAPALGGHHTEV